MPRMEGEQNEPIKGVWVYLSDKEAMDLWLALDDYMSEPTRPGWHCHVTDSDGNELTVEVGEPE